MVVKIIDWANACKLGEGVALSCELYACLVSGAAKLSILELPSANIGRSQIQCPTRSWLNGHTQCEGLILCMVPQQVLNVQSACFC